MLRTRRLEPRTALRNALLVAALIAFGGAGVWLLERLVGSAHRDFVIDPTGVQPWPSNEQALFAWQIAYDELPSDDLEDNSRSPLQLLEDGEPLGPAHSLHADVNQLGNGRFSHWTGALIFSTSDNTDPRFNGRTYTITRGPGAETRASWSARYWLAVLLGAIVAAAVLGLWRVSSYLPRVLPPLFFVLSLMLLSFGYGVAATSWQLFPYGILREAQLAFQAWSEVTTRNRDAYVEVLPEGFRGLEPGASGVPIATSHWTETPEETLILVAGGPYQLSEHCPTFGCLAWVVDREGRVAHAWEVDLEELWDDTGHLSGTIDVLKLYPVGLRAFGNGDLVAVFQARDAFPYAAGIARVDVEGRLLWKRMDYSHHWPDVDEQGRIYTPAGRVIESPVRVGETPFSLECDQGRFREDLIRVLSPDGKVVRELSLLELLAASDYAGLVSAVPDHCDPTHLNSIDVADSQDAAGSGIVEVGDMLVSLRSPNAVALLDGETGAVKYAVTGRTIAQHSAHFAGGDRVLVFDNLGGDRSWGGSRLVSLDLAGGRLERIFPAGGALEGTFGSEVAGQIDVSRDRSRALVSITNEGRILEVSLTDGKVLWEYDNLHDMGPRLREAGFAIQAGQGRFATYGAYYLESDSFVSERQAR